MAVQILINLLFAVAWMFVQKEYTMMNFFSGYIFGIISLFILRPLLRTDFYLYRVWAIIKLIWLFIIELIKANIDVVKIVMRPKLNNEPGIVAVKTRLETDFEVTLLAALISLTPGTVSMDFSEDSKTIYIHAIDVPDEEEMIEDIHNTFERAILEVTK